MKPIRNKVLKPLFPNVGVEMEYRRRLYALVDAMHKSISYWVKKKYKANEPVIAMDEVIKRFERRYGVPLLAMDDEKKIIMPIAPAHSVPEDHTGPAGPSIGATTKAGGEPRWNAYVDGEMLKSTAGVGRTFKSAEAAEAAVKAALGSIGAGPSPASVLRIAVNKLVRRWQKRFDKAASELADYFTDDVEERTDARMKRILKEGGFSVKFKMTPAMKDISKATVNANVSLIKSIPQQYLRNVEGIVMRSVQAGRDLGPLAKDLEKQYGVTKRRAALIARDQNNKATSAFQRARQQELGITTAVWMHSHAGKEPRPTHVKMDGRTYDIKKGMWDSAVGEYILPGQLINCRCTSRSVVPGFE